MSCEVSNIEYLSKGTSRVNTFRENGAFSLPVDIHRALVNRVRNKPVDTSSRFSVVVNLRNTVFRLETSPAVHLTVRNF